MQVYQVYSLRDSKAGTFSRPFMKLSQAEAVRDFTQLARDPSSQVSAFPEDFDLYHLGEFNDETGKHNLLETPAHIVKAVQLPQHRPMSVINEQRN